MLTSTGGVGLGVAIASFHTFILFLSTRLGQPWRSRVPTARERQDQLLIGVSFTFTKQEVAAPRCWSVKRVIYLSIYRVSRFGYRAWQGRPGQARAGQGRLWAYQAGFQKIDHSRSNQTPLSTYDLDVEESSQPLPALPVIVVYSY